MATTLVRTGCGLDNFLNARIVKDPGEVTVEGDSLRVDEADLDGSSQGLGRSDDT